MVDSSHTEEYKKFQKLNQAYTDGKIEHVQLAELARCYRDGHGTEKDVYKAFEFYVKALEFGVIDQGKLQSVLEEFKEFAEKDLNFISQQQPEGNWKGNIGIQWSQNSQISQELANSICNYAVTTIKSRQHPLTSTKLAYDIANIYQKFSKNTTIDFRDNIKYIDKATIIYLRALVDIKAGYTTGKNDGDISFNIEAVNELIETKKQIIDRLLQVEHINENIKEELKGIKTELDSLKPLDEQSSSEELFTNYRKIIKLLAPIPSKLKSILDNSLEITNIDLIDFYEKAIMLGNSDSIKNFLPKLIEPKYLNIGLSNKQIKDEIEKIWQIQDPNQRYLALSSFYRNTLKDKKTADQFLLFPAGYGVPLVYSYEFGLDDKTPNNVAKEALKDGNPDAIYQLSQFSKPISGITSGNPRQYIFLLENAAEKGQPDAMVEYGKILLYGIPQTKIIHKYGKDPIRAFKFFSDAAKVGNIDAMIELGICYANGIGIEQNFEQAVNCFLMAILMAIERQKIRNKPINTDVLVQLGLIWDKIPDELKKNTLALLKLFKIFESDNVLNITPFNFYKKAYNLDNNNSTAALNLGLCYLNGYNTPQNLKQAFVYFKEAAGIKDIEIFFNNYKELNKLLKKQNELSDKEKKQLNQLKLNTSSFIDKINPKNTEALLQVGLCCLYEWGIERNEQLGFKIIERAANLGNVNAKYQLVMCYQAAIGNLKKLPLIERGKIITTLLNDIAFNEQDSNAMFQLGLHYIHMSDIIQNQEEKENYKNSAIDTIEEVIKLGNVNAMVYLANLYYVDLTINENYKKAFELYQRAADLGNHYAMYNLAECYEFGNGTQKDINKAIEFYERASKFPETQEQAQAKLKEISKQQPATGADYDLETTPLKFIEDEDFYSEDDDKSEDDSTEINEKEFISTDLHEEESVKDNEIETDSKYNFEKNSRETSKTDLPTSEKELKREIKKLKKNRNKLRDQIIKNYKWFSFKRRIYPFLHFVHYQCKKKEIIEQYNKTYQKREQDLETLDKKIEEAKKRLQKLELEKKHKSWFKKQKEASNGRV